MEKRIHKKYSSIPKKKKKFKILKIKKTPTLHIRKETSFTFNPPERNLQKCNVEAFSFNEHHSSTNYSYDGEEHSKNQIYYSNLMNSWNNITLYKLNYVSSILSNYITSVNTMMGTEYVKQFNMKFFLK
jgi:hypothetical protein